jgi:beta-glucosidase
MSPTGMVMEAATPAFAGIALTTASEAAATFPAGFVWGAATSSFQIEGARGSRGECIWDRFCARPGAILDDSNGDGACDHLHRWREDVGLLRELGLGAYRFSIAWPRILPTGRGPVAQAGLDHYSRLIDGLLDAGITPYVTLYHWDLPQELEDAGGWPARVTAEAFADYVEIVVGHLGDRVRHWSTLNEPYCSAIVGYVQGRMAPGRRSEADGFAAAHHLLLGHGLAVERIRALAPGAEVGIVLNFAPMHPASDRTEDIAAAHREHRLHNRWFVEPVLGLGSPADTMPDAGWDGAEIRAGDLDVIAAPIDVLGVNYYTRNVVAADPDSRPLPANLTGSGWEIYPAGLTETLRWLHNSYAFPRYLVTENGAAMDDEPDPAGRVDDHDRIDYLRRHLHAVHDAIVEGVPVGGYFVWSLLDNFEWAMGYTSRFGIVRVDYDTFARVPKASADWYAGVARTNTVP